ncbi:MAG: hypothetical protein ABWZ91_06935 [Nocardioides sp.]
MSWRGLGALLVLALIGAAGGYLAADLREPTTSNAAQASPVPAESPSIPVDPEQPFAEDITYPPLATSLDYRPHTIGDPPFQWTYEAPKGWKATEEGLDEIRWRPPDEPEIGGFSLRVKLTTEHKTKADMVIQKLGMMQAGYEDVDIVGQTQELLSFTYRDATRNVQRFNTFRWFSLPGEDEARVEMSVVGRAVDVPGLQELLDRVGASIEKVP